MRRLTPNKHRGRPPAYLTAKGPGKIVDRPHEHGPFDIIGDVHGCFDELSDLLRALGYQLFYGGEFHLESPPGRKLIFLGDLTDRGPDAEGVLNLVSSLIKTGQAFCVPGNHDIRLMNVLRGELLPKTHGLAETLQQLGGLQKSRKNQFANFIDLLPGHLVLDDGKLVVAHAGLRESMHGKSVPEARLLSIFGEKTGRADRWGDIRYDWTADYHGEALVAFGHTPVPKPLWRNNTVNLDTGCAFGGSLTALRYPELKTVSVPARERYSEPNRPFLPDDPRMALPNDRIRESRRREAPRKAE